MGLRVSHWLHDKMFGCRPDVNLDYGDLYERAGQEVQIKELAFWTCVNKIANALCKCEFKTYVNGQETRGDEYYLLNVQPNINQNASMFWTKFVGSLYRRNEVLVVDLAGQLFVADSYSKNDEKLVYGYTFSGVVINQVSLDKTFRQEDVIFLRLNSRNMRELIRGIFSSYKKMIMYSVQAYNKSRGNRGILEVDAIAQGNPSFEETFKRLTGEYFKSFFENENAVLPLFSGYKYTDLSQNTKTYSNENTRDIKALIDDVFDYTARAFSVPPSLAKGDVQDTSKAIDELLTFCIDPLAKMIEQELNRVRNGKRILSGTYTAVDTTHVKHIDIFDISTPVDKLISSGAFCINDILRIVGYQEIDEDWAKQHWITKNYTAVQDLYNLSDVEQEDSEETEEAGKGGEEDEQVLQS